MVASVISLPRNTTSVHDHQEPIFPPTTSTYVEQSTRSAGPPPERNHRIKRQSARRILATWCGGGHRGIMSISAAAREFLQALPLRLIPTPWTLPQETGHLPWPRMVIHVVVVVVVVTVVAVVVIPFLLVLWFGFLSKTWFQVSHPSTIGEAVERDAAKPYSQCKCQARFLT